MELEGRGLCNCSLSLFFLLLGKTGGWNESDLQSHARAQSHVVAIRIRQGDGVVRHGSAPGYAVPANVLACRHLDHGVVGLSGRDVARDGYAKGHTSAAVMARKGEARQGVLILDRFLAKSCAREEFARLVFLETWQYNLFGSRDHKPWFRRVATPTAYKKLRIVD